MTLEEVISTTKNFLEEEFEIDPSEIKSENNMHTTLDLDSLDYVDLVVVIEENFGVKVTADDFTGIKTFEDFYSFIVNKI